MAKLALYWPVCSDGYRLEWREGKTFAHGERHHVIVRNSARMRADADVMQIPALYERLAVCEPTAEGALTFVNKYGFLGNVRYAEPVSEICDQIKAVRQLLEFRKARNQDALDEWLVKIGDAIRLRAAFKEGQSPRFFFQPNSLIDAVYLQFFQDIENGANLRLCARPGCGEWFYYGPGTNPPRRDTALYCKPACQKAHAYAKTKGET